jgi:hypothetical protein
VRTRHSPAVSARTLTGRAEAPAGAVELEVQGHFAFEEEVAGVGGIDQGDEPLPLLEAERDQGLLESRELRRGEAAGESLLGEGDTTGRRFFSGPQPPDSAIGFSIGPVFLPTLKLPLLIVVV